MENVYLTIGKYTFWIAAGIGSLLVVLIFLIILSNILTAILKRFRVFGYVVEYFWKRWEFHQWLKDRKNG